MAHNFVAAFSFRSYTPRRRGGFTLVELLVVIGIIALLIALLLPALSKARAAGLRTSCSGKLHNMMLAAQLHRNTHRDFYPLAGIIPGSQPEDLSDLDMVKYDYFSYTPPGAGSASGRPLCPITSSLESQMARGSSLYSNYGILGVPDENGRDAAMLDPRGLTKNFICPAQAESPLDIIPLHVYMYIPLGGVAFQEPQSYFYNEYVCGWQDNLGHLRGRGSLVHMPENTIFAGDGFGGSPTADHGGFLIGAQMYTVYNNTIANPVSLADALADRVGLRRRFGLASTSNATTAK